VNPLYRRALRLEFLLLAYNTVEAVVSLIAGAEAGSIALTGFGLDSILELLSALVLVRRLAMHGRVSASREEKIESRASRFVGFTFLLLGVYVAYEAASKIVKKEIPDPSVLGMAVALVSSVVMPVLGLAKYRLGKKMKLKSLVADSKETLFCAALSVALLLGLGMNALFGFWVADPAAGLVIAFFLLKEGRELAFEGKG
jgi:divalent metal cation (Fe/Co/Zn/Cd) transporter